MNVIKDVTFEGRILDQIQKTIEYLETQVKEHSYLGEDGLFKTDREYPKFVIQEMTVNSVCHRDYSIKGTEIQIRCSTTVLCSNPLATCSVSSAQITSSTPTSLETPR